LGDVRWQLGDVRWQPKDYGMIAEVAHK